MNGVEVTVAELNEEARVRSLTIGSDRGLRDALVQELVERKLLVAQAEEAKLDQTPQFLLAERRLRDVLVAQQLLAGQQNAATMTQNQLEAFIRSRPLAFGQRVVARVDQLSIGGSLDAPTRRKLATARTVAEMSAQLRAAPVPVTRSVEAWDSADPANPLGAGQVEPTAGTPFLLPQGAGSIAGIVTDVTRQPVPAEQQAAFARALLERSNAERRMRLLLDKAKATAKIAYNPKFDPQSEEANSNGSPPP